MYLKGLTRFSTVTLNTVFLFNKKSIDNFLTSPGKCMLSVPIRSTLSNKYSKCPKILNTRVSDKMTHANSVDPDQTAPKEQSDLGLDCLSFHYVF